MINKLLSAVTVVALTAAPTAAKIDEGTVDLINTVSASDITVTIDDRFCVENPGYAGVYMHSGFRRELHLCPGPQVDADDHDTVRHEVWHALQHCVNVIRGTHLNTPINEDTTELMENVHALLHPKYIQFIQDTYPREEWLLEFEANLGAQVFSAKEIQDMFNKLCLS